MNSARINLMVCVIGLVLPAALEGQQPGFIDVDPGIGRFELGNSYLDVQETDDGHRLEYSLTSSIEATAQPSLRFLSAWQSESWTQLVVDLYDPQPSNAFATRFEPYDDGERQIERGSRFMLQPSRLYGISTRQLDYCAGCGPNTFTFEYSLVTATAPLTGDFNFDNRVNLRDFLILVGNFNRRDTFWHRGDANLDGKVNFVDFLRLRRNFGARRASPAAVAIPEPTTSATRLWNWSLLVALAFRRRRRSVPRARVTPFAE